MTLEQIVIIALVFLLIGVILGVILSRPRYPY